MRTLTALFLGIFLAASLPAKAEGGDVTNAGEVKTGFVLGALPRAGYDADNGFFCGLQLNTNNFRDGSIYPNAFSNAYMDLSYYRKGIFNLILAYDNKTLIPGARLCTSLQYCNDQFYNFYGFNGYQANFQPAGNLYRTHHKILNFKVDAVGGITDNLGWELGYHCFWTHFDNPESTDYYNLNGSILQLYRDWGIIPEDQVNGGLNSEIRAGLVYDTRDSEASPTRGIWAEGHLICAPKFLGTSVPYSKFSLNWRHYVPVCQDNLTFAYRIVWQGVLNDDAPWYILPYYTVVGPKFDNDGVGGFRTLRGVMLNRITGKQTAFFNTELRWRFWNFNCCKQNVSLCASTFFEGGKAVKAFENSFGANAAPVDGSGLQDLYNMYVDNSAPDKMHLSTGAGLRVIFNRNFIIAFEWGKSLNCTDGRFSNKWQDGAKKGCFYLNTGFTF